MTRMLGLALLFALSASGCRRTEEAREAALEAAKREPAPAVRTARVTLHVAGLKKTASGAT